MAVEFDNDFGVRIVQMVLSLLTNTTKQVPHMISKDLQEGGAELEALSATLSAPCCWRHLQAKIEPWVYGCP